MRSPACAIALGFLAIAAMDFGTRAVAVYNQVKATSNSPSTNIEKPLTQLPPAVTPQKFPPTISDCQLAKRSNSTLTF